jgi:ABC-type polar amino acid transport system ATPase subunit
MRMISNNDGSSSDRALVGLWDIGKEIGEKRILAGVSFSVHRGTTTCLVGPSGGGKTTILKLVAGIETPSEGSIHRAPDVRYAYVPQNIGLWPHMTAAENCALSLRHRKLPEDQIEEEVTAWLDRFGIGQLARRKPHQLSGGEQQRVALARAFVSGAELMIFDEITSALDPETTVEIIRVLEEWARKKTTICATHHMGFAQRIADHILYVESGRVLEKVDRGALIHPNSKLGKLIRSAKYLADPQLGDS